MTTPGFMLSPTLLGKVRTTIARVEGEPIGSGKWTIPTRFEGEEKGGSGKHIHVVTFTGSWSKGSAKTVTFKFQTTTPNTVSATNLLLNIPSACGTASTATVALIAKEGTAWYYANHERACDNQFPAKELDADADCDSSTSGISEGSGVQVLLNEDGCAKWWKLSRQQVVSDVRWEDGIVVEKKYVWVVRDPNEATEATIIESVECEEEE